MESGTGASPGQMPLSSGGQILPQLMMEATNGMDIHHETEESNDRKVNDMIENYTSHLFQQQKQKSTASSQQFRQFIPKQQQAPPHTSHSHPCLFTIDGNKQHLGRASDEYRQSPNNNPDRGEVYETYTNGGPIFYQEAPPTNTTPPNTIVVKMSDLTALRADNEVLRKAVDTLELKVGRLRQLEHSYDRIVNDFDQVINQREQQENIEKMAMNKMEQHIQRLMEDNEMLLKRLEDLGSFGGQHLEMNSVPQPSQDNMQLARLTMLLNEYVAQNKELQSANDRQKMEIDAQNATLNDQTNHIVMLENALSNIQEKLAAKDRQLMESSAFVDRYNKLQKLLKDSLEDKQRIQDEFMKEKAHLEMELTQVKMQKENPSPRKSRTSPEPEENSKMRRVIADKEAKIAHLENMILQLQKKYGNEQPRNELSLKAEIETINARQRKLELEKQEKNRKIQDLMHDNKRLHDQLLDERSTMDRRFSLLEEDVRRLAMNRASTSTNVLYNNPPPFPGPMTRSYQANAVSGFPPIATAISVSSLQQFDRDPVFTRQRGEYSVDTKMEELRRNIADKRNSQPRSLSRSRMPQGPMNSSNNEEPLHRKNSNTHYRASSGPSSVVHSTKVNDAENQAEMERQIAEYMASLPASSRRRFVLATGLDEKDFVPQNLNLYQVTHNVTPSLPEGAKLPLSRQISKGSSVSSSSRRQLTSVALDPSKDGKDPSSIRIHLIEPSSDRKLESDDSDELNSRTSSSNTPSEPTSEPQTPASAVSAASFTNNLVNNPNTQGQFYSYDVQPPQSITEIHTTTVVEVNKDQLGNRQFPRRHQQRILSHQSNSGASDGGGSMDNSR